MHSHIFFLVLAIVLSSHVSADSIHYRGPHMARAQNTSSKASTGRLSPADWCQMLGPDCQLVDGKPSVSNHVNPVAGQVLATNFGQAPASLNPGHSLLNTTYHPDGNSSHIYAIRYSDALVPIGVCNPVTFMEMILQRNCPKGDANDFCQFKANWPCGYEDDRNPNWSPVDQGQRDVGKCTMGIEGSFLTNIMDGNTRYADFMKDWALKAMQVPTMVPGGNQSIAPVTSGHVSPPNVTAWTVPASMTAMMWETGPYPLSQGGQNYIKTYISCPRPKSTSLCGVMAAIFAVAVSLLAIGTEGVTAGALGAVGAAGGVGGVACTAATS